MQPSGQRLLPLPVSAVARRGPQLPKLQALHAGLLLLLRLLRWRWRLLLLGRTKPRRLRHAMALHSRCPSCLSHPETVQRCGAAIDAHCVRIPPA